MPRSIAALRRLLKSLAVLAILAAAIGILSSIDALVADLRTPKDELVIVAGSSAMITGKLAGEADGRSLSVLISPQDGTLRASDINVERTFDGNNIRWSALISASSEAIKGDYTISVGTNDTPRQRTERWYVTVLPTEADLESSSLSVLRHTFGASPLKTAFIALFCAALAGILYFALAYFGSKWLASCGFVRVYHTRREGDDTVLYCIAPESAFAQRETYPVLTAVGQMLGMAEVVSHGARYCVLKLSAANARAGCLIALSLSPEQLDI